MQRSNFARFARMASIMLVLVGLMVSSHIGLYGQSDDDDTLTIRARRGADIETMDPAFHNGNEEYNLNMVVYSHLMKYEPGTSELVLDAAESMETSEDGLRVSFKLREGIQFHQGYGEMTAEDVKFSFERIIDPEVESAYSGDWATLDRVEVTGRYTGELVFTEPLATLYTSTIPFSSGAILSKAAFEDLGDRFATNPVGSGPYAWAEWEPNQRMVLERFDDYYGEAPAYSRIEILPIGEDQSAEVAFDRGELDETSISLSSIERYQNNPDVNVHELTNLRYHFLGFNVTKAPFDDVQVREAIRLAVDVDEVIAGAYNGIPSRNDCMLPEEILGHWEDCPRYEQDLNQARQLLADAGYPDGFDTTLITNTIGVHQDAVQIIQQQLRQVGVDVELRVLEDAYTPLTEGPAGMHYYSFSLTLDPDYWMIWFSCDQVGNWNFPQWCNERFDELQQEGATTLDRDRREEIYVEMQQIMDEEVPVVWITNGASVHVSRPSVDPVYLGQYSQYNYWTQADGE